MGKAIYIIHALQFKKALIIKRMAEYSLYSKLSLDECQWITSSEALKMMHTRCKCRKGFDEKTLEKEKSARIIWLLVDSYQLCKEMHSGTNSLEDKSMSSFCRHSWWHTANWIVGQEEVVKEKFWLGTQTGLNALHLVLILKCLKCRMIYRKIIVWAFNG